MRRRPRRAAGALVVSGMLLAVIGCRDDTIASQVDQLADVFHRQAQEEGLSREQTAGKRLFTRYCVTCHGDAGEGDGQNAYSLDPSPPDFRASLRTHPSTHWRQIIEGGTSSVGRSPLCPPWGRTFTTVDIDGLVAFLDALAGP